MWAGTNWLCPGGGTVGVQANSPFSLGRTEEGTHLLVAVDAGALATPLLLLLRLQVPREWEEASDSIVGRLEAVCKKQIAGSQETWVGPGSTPRVSSHLSLSFLICKMTGLRSVVFQQLSRSL